MMLWNSLPRDVMAAKNTSGFQKKRLDNFMEKGPSRNIKNNDTAAASSSGRSLNQKTLEAGRVYQRKYHSILVLFSIYKLLTIIKRQDVGLDRTLL